MNLQFNFTNGQKLLHFKLGSNSTFQDMNSLQPPKIIFSYAQNLKMLLKHLIPSFYKPTVFTIVKGETVTMYFTKFATADSVFHKKYYPSCLIAFKYHICVNKTYDYRALAHVPLLSFPSSKFRCNLCLSL